MEKMNRDNPGIKHEERRELLSTVAILSGYDLNYNKCLPDGTRPDVLRMDARCGSIFLGEAKDTESPSCIETCKRLSNYMNWFCLITHKRRGSSFVVCSGDESQTVDWQDTLSRLAVRAGFVNFSVECRSFGDEAFFTWLKLFR